MRGVWRAVEWPPLDGLESDLDWKLKMHVLRDAGNWPQISRVHSTTQRNTLLPSLASSKKWSSRTLLDGRMILCFLHCPGTRYDTWMLLGQRPWPMAGKDVYIYSQTYHDTPVIASWFQRAASDLTNYINAQEVLVASLFSLQKKTLHPILPWT